MKATLLAAFSLIALTALSSNAAGLQFNILSPDSKATIGSTSFTVLRNDSTEEIKGETRYLDGERDSEDVRLDVEDTRSTLKLDTYEHSFFNADGIAVANNFGVFDPTGVAFPSSFFYWTDLVKDITPPPWTAPSR